MMLLDEAWAVLSIVPDAAQRLAPVVQMVRMALAYAPDSADQMFERIRAQLAEDSEVPLSFIGPATEALRVIAASPPQALT